MPRKKKPPKFTESFGKYACVGDKISVKVGKLTVTAEIIRDDHMGKPWKEHDGHGPVSGWEHRDKRPGERVLHEDHGSKLYYDFQEAVKIAKRDGWGCGVHPGGESCDFAKRRHRTHREVAACAAEQDFQRMRAWCRDEWCWVGVSLSVSKNGVTLGAYAASLWGIESDSNDYLTEVANELLPEALEAAEKVLEKLKA